MASQVETATELFLETFLRWSRGFGTLYGFTRSVSVLGQSQGAGNLLATDHQRITLDLRPEPEWIGGWDNLVDAAHPTFQRRIAESFHDESPAYALQGGMHSACVVFAHSVIDAVTSDCCRVSAVVAPHDWEQDLSQRQVSLGEIKERTYPEILNDRLLKYMSALERDPLLKRVDLLHLRCPPSEMPASRTGYRFDRDRVERFDRLRHEIIHGNGMGEPIAGLEDELSFINRTCGYMLNLVGRRYGLRLDPSRWAPRVQSGGP